MLTKRTLFATGLLLLALPWANAQAGWGVGITIAPGPYYYRPYYGPGYYYYYRPYPVYVAPPPVVVQPAPAYDTVPPPPPTSPGGTTLQPVPAQPVQPIARAEDRAADIDQALQHLANPDERVRADMARRLGQLHALRAAEPLERVLASDRSPAVRNAAARALGLIGARASLAALQRAAQADEDRDVRDSAQYSIDVIRGR